jgi:CheY-like chemotaxis protein
VAAPPAKTMGQRRFRVIVIEDNLDAAASLRIALELDGHQVRTAFDGPSGIALVHDFKPQIVICDIGLPGMDGYAVAQALRSEDALKGTFLIALSGYALPEDMARSKEAGFDRHLAKPVGLDTLARLMAEVPV